MIKKYIEEAMWTPELEKSLSESKVLPMARDICHGYDLKVSQRRLVRYKRYADDNETAYKLSNFPLDDRQNDNTYCPYEDEDTPHYKSETIKQEFEGWQDFEGFVLAHKGLDRAMVFIDDKNNYCFHTNYEIKDRGSDDWDRKTVRSKKLSQVLRALKRKKYVPIQGGYNNATESYELGTVGQYIFDESMDTREMCYEYQADITRTGEQANLNKLTNHYENKIYELTSSNRKYLSEIIMCLFKDKTAIPHNVTEHYTNELKNIDEYRDDIKEAHEQIKQEMDNGFIAIGVSNNVGYLVGEATQNPESKCVDDRGKEKYGVDFTQLELTNAQRVRQLDDLPFYDSLKPTLAMLKLKLEDWANKSDYEVFRDYYKSNRSYDESKWFEDIGCYYPNMNKSKTGLSSMNWLLVPKPKF